MTANAIAPETVKAIWESGYRTGVDAGSEAQCRDHTAMLPDAAWDYHVAWALSPLGSGRIDPTRAKDWGDIP